MSPEPVTGTWNRPLCLARIPVTVYANRTADGLVFVDSPWPLADVSWHIEFERPEGMD